MPEKTIEIRLLGKNDDRKDFRSGDIELDRFFQRYAGQNQFRHYIGSTYVAVLDSQIVAFITVSTGELTAELLRKVTKKYLPDYPIPILRIARLAVEQRFQGLGIGKKLLSAMFKLAVVIKDQAGCTGVVVDAKLDAIMFYEKLGFMRMNSVNGELRVYPEPLPMFLPVREIEKALPGER